MHAPRSRGAARAQSDSSVNITKVIVIKHDRKLDRKVVIVRNTLASILHNDIVQMRPNMVMKRKSCDYSVQY